MDGFFFTYWLAVMDTALILIRNLVCMSKDVLRVTYLDALVA
jgi:hypothetical protein